MVGVLSLASPRAILVGWFLHGRDSPESVGGDDSRWPEPVRGPSRSSPHSAVVARPQETTRRTALVGRSPDDCDPGVSQSAQRWIPRNEQVRSSILLSGSTARLPVNTGGPARSVPGLGASRPRSALDDAQPGCVRRSLIASGPSQIGPARLACPIAQTDLRPLRSLVEGCRSDIRAVLRSTAAVGSRSSDRLLVAKKHLAATSTSWSSSSRGVHCSTWCGSRRNSRPCSVAVWTWCRSVACWTATMTCVGTRSGCEPERRQAPRRHSRHVRQGGVARRAGSTHDRSDELLWLALERAIEITGEAATRVSDETKASFPAVAWKELSAVRVVLAHGYHRVDLDLLWGIAADDLPQVAAELGPPSGVEDDRR